MVELLRTFTPRPEIILEEVPAPQKLAAHSFAFTADISNGLQGDSEDEIASEIEVWNLKLHSELLGG